MKWPADHSTGGPWPQLEVLVAALEDVHGDTWDAATVLLGAVVEEALVEGRHLLHRLRGADQHLVPRVGHRDVVGALNLGRLVPFPVLAVVFGDPLTGHIGEEVHRLGVCGQARIRPTGDALDRGLGTLMFRVQSQHLIEDANRSVGTVVLLVGTCKLQEVCDVALTEAGQLGR